MDALRFNVAGLLKDPAGATRDYDVEASPSELAPVLEEAEPGGALSGHVQLMRTQRSIFVRGHLETEVVVECSRCLAAATVPIAFDIQEEFFPQVDVLTGHAVPLPEEVEEAFTIDSTHELDLTELVRQQLLLELPMQAVCRETCEGLCPRCGADLNQGPCACPDEEVDERLAPLRALLERAAGGR
jgi:uncharacterized protein